MNKFTLFTIFTIFTIIITFSCVAYAWYSLWISIDTSMCKVQTCITLAWQLRGALIGIPIFFLVICIYFFRPSKEPESPFRSLPKGFDNTSSRSFT